MGVTWTRTRGALAGPSDVPGLTVELSDADWGGRFWPVARYRADACWWGPTEGWCLSLRLARRWILTVRRMRETPAAHEKYRRLLNHRDEEDGT